jgi:hypothetical protein
VGVAHFVRWFASGLLSLLAPSACSSSGKEPVLPYPVGQAMVFGASPEGAVAVQMGPSCTSEACAAVLTRCGGNVYAEVVLGTTGSVLDVICYRGDLGVRELDDAPFDQIGSEHETVFVFDALDDGADLLEDVVVTGEGDVLYGAGADVSVLGAGLGIDAPGTIVRGLTVRGDVIVDKNDVKLSLVEIYGDLTINGNQVTLSESIVHGEVLVVGSNAVLARNLLEGTGRLTGTNLECSLNQRFDDRNTDRQIEDGELGPEIACR